MLRAQGSPYVICTKRCGEWSKKTYQKHFEEDLLKMDGRSEGMPRKELVGSKQAQRSFLGREAKASAQKKKKRMLPTKLFPTVLLGLLFPLDGYWERLCYPL